MNKAVLDKVMQVRGVKGAAILESSGEVSASRMDSKELTEFFGLLHRMANEQDGAPKLGEIRRIVVRTDNEEDLSLVLKDKNALAIVSERSRPQTELFAEVTELLQQV
jgi:predicted regulator of Ras-like GTPase activity (Roadblock/LC7/MglB family)